MDTFKVSWTPEQISNRTGHIQKRILNELLLVKLYLTNGDQMPNTTMK